MRDHQEQNVMPITSKNMPNPRLKRNIKEDTIKQEKLNGSATMSQDTLDSSPANNQGSFKRRYKMLTYDRMSTIKYWSQDLQPGRSRCISSWLLSQGLGEDARSVRFVKLRKAEKKKPANLLLTITIGLLLVAINNNNPAATYNPGERLQPQINARVVGPDSALSASVSTPSSSITAGATGPKQQATTGSLQELASVNLIPVDQPLASSPVRGAAVSSDGKLEMLERPEERQAGGFEIDPSLGSTQSTAAIRPQQAASGVESNSSSSIADDFAQLDPGGVVGQSYISDQSLPAFEQEVVYSFATNSNNNARQQAEQQKPFNEQQQQQQIDETQQAQQLSPSSVGAVERRFGLFKKGHHVGGHQPAPAMYGQPTMSSSYLAAPFSQMTDCERCLASLGQSANTGPLNGFGELQAIDPAPLAPPPPPPQSTTQLIPMPQATYPAASNHHFGPLKSKLFMKFPFFIKPHAFGASDPGSHSAGGLMPFSSFAQHHHQTHGPSSSGGFWPGYQPMMQPTQRPASSGALYLRAAPSYNCIQATPPQILAAAASTVSGQTQELMAPPPPPSTKGGSHQYHVHHLSSPASQATKHYAAISQQQQQQQTGYVSR